MPKISAVLPVYNVERYLTQCIESVLKQSFTDIEIILVDDGSPDRCGEIIDDFASKDSRIIPIHQSNGGYGSAVNAGLDLANGDYVSIIETDDWIEPEMFDRLYEASRLTESEVIKSGFKKIHSERYIQRYDLSHINRSSEATVKPAQSLSLMLFESSIWSALYKKSFLDRYQIKMLETPGAAYQDVVWKFMTYSVCNQVSIVDKPFYNYRAFAIGSSSVNTSNALAMFGNYKQIKKFLENNNAFSVFKESYYLHQMFDCVFHVNRLSGAALESFATQAKEMISEANNNQVYLEQMSFDEPDKKYVEKYVLPVYNAILQGSIGPMAAKLHFRRYLQSKLPAIRFFKSKLAS